MRGMLISAMPLAVYSTRSGTRRRPRSRLFPCRDRGAGLGADGALGHPAHSAALGLYRGLLLYLLRHGPGDRSGRAGRCPMALACNAMATATIFVCLNAYVLDYVDRANLGRSQSTQMVYAATPWAHRADAGVWLHHQWAPAPFCWPGSFAHPAADRLLGAAAWQRQADPARQAPGGQPAGLSGPVLPPAPADCGLDVRGDAQLRLVGLCRLPADLLHRGGPWRQGRRHRLVDHQCAAFRSPCPEPAWPPPVGPPVGPRLAFGACGVLLPGGRSLRVPALGDGRADHGGARSSW